MLVANGCVALITSGGALVVLLIAPLGLAAVVTCTVLVALLSFTVGLVADVLLWQHLVKPGEATLLYRESGTLRAPRGAQLPAQRRRQAD